MKKIWIIAIIITIYLIPQYSFASENIGGFNQGEYLNNQDNNKQNYNNQSTNNENENTLESQANEYGVSSFLRESKKYTEELDISEIFNSSVKGKFDNNKILQFISNILGENLKSALLTLSGIIIVIIINSILKAISENLGNESVSKIAYYIEYILIVTLVMKNFSNIIESMKNTLQNLTAFANSLIPLMTTLMIATGSITTSSIIEPILLLIVTFISNFIINVLIPIILVSTALGIVSKLSDQIQVDKISKFLKKGSVWTLTTILTLFITIAALEGGVTGTIDGVALKTSKSIVSTVVPVVGKILGDAVDTVMGYSNIIKNAVGIVGIVVILSICIKPIINLAAFTIIYYLGAALCEPIADEKIVSLIEQMAGTFKILLAIMFTVTAVLIVGVAIVMKVSNSGLMYG